MSDPLTDLVEARRHLDLLREGRQQLLARAVQLETDAAYLRRTADSNIERAVARLAAAEALAHPGISTSEGNPS